VIDLDALVVFAKVVEAGSFSSAGRRMGMPVSTVSRRVAELEDRLGARLLQRSTRQIRLTELGAEILEQARRGVEIEEAVAAIASNRSAAANGTIRISAPPSLSESLIVPLVMGFKNLHPAVDIRIYVTDRHVDLIAEGFDLAFRTGPLKDSTLVGRSILKYRHLLLASPEYLRDKKHPTTPQELLEHRLCAFSFWAQDVNWTLEKAAERQTIAFKPHFSLNDYSGLAGALVEGAGIGEMPSIVAPDWRAQSGLVEVLPEWQFPIEELFMLHAGNRHVTFAVRLLKEYVFDNFGR
jgi:DNA-binding transcriptional LysR family regulator